MIGTNFSDNNIAKNGGTVNHYFDNDEGAWIFIRGTAALISAETGAGYATGCIAMASDTGVAYYNSGNSTTASWTAFNSATFTVPTSVTDSTTTVGNSFRVLTTAGTFTTGGAAIKADLAAGLVGNGLVAITSGAYTGTGLLLVSGVAATSGNLANLIGTGLTTGNGLYISAVTATLTTGKYINCYNGATSDFTVGKYGATVIAGNALGTAALTVTAGDLVVSSGNVKATLGGFLSASPTVGGVGYATGAGGTVTQITTRSTGVTLSKLTGTIQTMTTSLAAGASAEFTVTNTAVAIGDVIVLSQQSGSSNVAGTAGVTTVQVVTVAAGSFIISVMNNSSTTAETGAIIINYAIIKAVSA